MKIFASRVGKLVMRGPKSDLKFIFLHPDDAGARGGVTSQPGFSKAKIPDLEGFEGPCNYRHKRSWVGQFVMRRFQT